MILPTQFFHGSFKHIQQKNKALDMRKKVNTIYKETDESGKKKGCPFVCWTVVVTKLPRLFVHPPEYLQSHQPYEGQRELPMIDLDGAERSGSRRKEVVEEMGKAAAGFLSASSTTGFRWKQWIYNFFSFAIYNSLKLGVCMFFIVQICRGYRDKVNILANVIRTFQIRSNSMPVSLIH